MYLRPHVTPRANVVGTARITGTATTKAGKKAAEEIEQGIHHQEDAAAHAPDPNVPSCKGQKKVNVKL
jgi:hypothetical protein